MSHEQKIKCKLLKVSSKRDYCYSEELLIIEDISQFEELTYADFARLERWVYDRKNDYVLIRPLDETHIRTAIKDQIAAEEERARELEIKRLEREKAETEKNRLREAKKIERAKKKLEELNKLVSQHENSISND